MGRSSRPYIVYISATVFPNGAAVALFFSATLMLSARHKKWGISVASEYSVSG